MDARLPGNGAAADTYLWHSQAQMSTVRDAERVIVRGRGAHVWDASGARLLDLPGNQWSCHVGHGRPEIAKAVADQMASLETYSTFQQFATPPALRLAERLSLLSPLQDPRVYFTSGGSDAVDFAVKLARAYWTAIGQPGKATLISRRDSYHGLHGFGTSLSGIPSNRDGFGPLLPGTALVDRDDAEALESLVQEMGADSVAAFICEPVVGAGGVFPPPEGYLRRVQQICRDNDVLFIVDEVITGFGRVGALFASELYGLSPDVLLLAKGLTSGYLPLGATVVAERLWRPFWQDGSPLVLHHGLTFAGHASACAAALANIDILQKEQLVERVQALEPVLQEALAPLAEEPEVAEVRFGGGLLAAVAFSDAAVSRGVAADLLEEGIIGRQLVDGSLHVCPPFVVEESELYRVGQAVAGALRRRRGR